MTAHTRRAAPVIALFTAFTLIAIGRRVGMVVVPGHADRTMVEFVILDVVRRLGVLLVACEGVWLISYSLHRCLARGPKRA
jgi:hypothetical protein